MGAAAGGRRVPHGGVPRGSGAKVPRPRAPRDRRPPDGLHDEVQSVAGGHCHRQAPPHSPLHAAVRPRDAQGPVRPRPAGLGPQARPRGALLPLEGRRRALGGGHQALRSRLDHRHGHGQGERLRQGEPVREVCGLERHRARALAGGRGPEAQVLLAEQDGAHGARRLPRVGREVRERGAVPHGLLDQLRAEVLGPPEALARGGRRGLQQGHDALGGDEHHHVAQAPGVGHDEGRLRCLGHRLGEDR
mmetsp:Transcript_8450/g.24193  ORF Transcript_8450/g.24193 Transcript_8450/m.24193 type:complete len:247 (+) Transcript_8450:631-1371(+)